MRTTDIPIAENGRVSEIRTRGLIAPSDTCWTKLHYDPIDRYRLLLPLCCPVCRGTLGGDDRVLPL